MAGPISPQQWERVSELLDQALELPASERRAFLEHASAGDLTVLAWVKRLLAQQPLLTTFLSTAVPDALGRIAADSCAATAFEPGYVLAERFEIRSFIGAGGMGQVYEVFDLDLAGC